MGAFVVPRGRTNSSDDSEPAFERTSTVGGVRAVSVTLQEIVRMRRYSYSSPCATGNRFSARHRPTLATFRGRASGERSLGTDSSGGPEAFLEVRNMRSGVGSRRAREVPERQDGIECEVTKARTHGTVGQKGHAEAQGHDDRSGSRTHGRLDPQGRARPRGKLRNGQEGRRGGQGAGRARRLFEAGHKGGQRVKRLIEEGKRAEGECAGISEREDKGKGMGRTKLRH